MTYAPTNVRRSLTILVLVCLASLASFWIWTHPTPLPARLLDACLEEQVRSVDKESHVSLGDTTWVALEGQMPWRCEIPLRPDPGSRLAFAIGTPQNTPSFEYRVSFHPSLGGSRFLAEGTVPASGASPSWQYFTVELDSLRKGRGRVILEFGMDSSKGISFYLGDPVIFRPEEKPRSNLVLVLLDSLRADHVGFNAYSRPTTPRMDALAAEGTIFSNVHSPTSWTRPSTATLFTGLEPSEHRVNTRNGRMPSDVVTLAEKLREAGYATSAFSGNPNILPYWGFDRGFERFIDVSFKQWIKWNMTGDVALMIKLALAELERIRNRPFFLYLHVNQIHFPYWPPEEHLRVLGLSAERAGDLYDADIRFTDAELGRIWDRLRSLGLDEHTLLVVVADHGEEFGDHGGIFHGRTLYEEVLRIPLFLRWPGEVPSGRRISRPIRLAELNPLILSLLGVGPDGDAGASLLAAGEERPEEDRLVQNYKLDIDGHLLYGLRDGPWKYINTVRPKTREELYDLASDPGEHHNLAATELVQKERMSERLQAHLSAQRPGLRVRLSASPGESRSFSVSLRTYGRVKEILRVGLERGDKAEVSKDGKRVEIQATVVGAPPQAGRAATRASSDVDNITLLLDPADSKVWVTARSESPAHPLKTLRLGTQTRGGEVNFNADAPELVVRTVTVEAAPAGDPAVWIYTLPRGSRVEGAIREDVEERLRALGYVR